MNRRCPSCSEFGISANKLFFWPVHCLYCGAEIAVSQVWGVLILSVEMLSFLFFFILISLYFGALGGLVVFALWAVIDLLRRTKTPLEVRSKPINQQAISYLIILSIGLTVLYFVGGMWSAPESTLLILFLAGFIYPIGAIFLLAISLLYYYAVRNKDKGVAIIASISLLYFCLWILLSFTGVSSFEQFSRSVFVYLSLAYGLACVAVSLKRPLLAESGNVNQSYARWGQIFSRVIAYGSFAGVAFFVGRYLDKTGSYLPDQGGLIDYYFGTVRLVSILGIIAITSSLFIRNKPLLFLSGLTFAFAVMQALFEMGVIGSMFVRDVSFVYVVVVISIIFLLLFWKLWVSRKRDISN